jgi:hypothetical protein
MAGSVQPKLFRIFVLLLSNDRRHAQMESSCQATPLPGLQCVHHSDGCLPASGTSSNRQQSEQLPHSLPVICFAFGREMHAGAYGGITGHRLASFAEAGPWQEQRARFYLGCSRYPSAVAMLWPGLFYSSSFSDLDCPAPLASAVLRTNGATLARPSHVISGMMLSRTPA